jgi:chloramphenicol O-acetyltransferase type A
MEIIDLNKWERKTHFNFFRQMDYPQYLISANIDITKFLIKIKERNISFYYGMIYAATYTLNQVKEFKYRIRGDEVILHSTIHPSFTDMTDDSGLFKIVNADMENGMKNFAIKAKEKASSQKDFIVMEDEVRDDLVYITSIPWVSFTSLTHTISLKKDDAVPRLSWGKYFEENGRVLMPFSLQAHHAFVDGIHMGRYFEVLQEYLDSCLAD